MTGIRIEVLAGFELSVNGQSVELPPAGQRLLAFLALSERPLRRSYVAGVLWGETTEDRAAARLRSTLWRLRRQTVGAVVIGTTRLQLGPEVQVDIREVTRILTELADECGDPARHIKRLPLTAELLPDWYEDWVHLERERYKQFRLYVLEIVCGRLLRDRCFAEAIQVALAAIAAEPLRDSAQRLLVSIYLSEGNRSEAVRQFHSYRDLLYRELGIRSSPEIESLITEAVGATTVKRSLIKHERRAGRSAARVMGSQGGPRLKH